LSAVFLGESWTLRSLPGLNVPYWSLNYEAWYYILFAAATFLRGRRRVGAIIGAALLTGPKILLLLPVWLMGVAAWQWRTALPRTLGSPVVIICLVGFGALQSFGGQQLFWHPHSRWLPPGFSLYDYVFCLIMALLIVGLANAPLPMPGHRIVHLVRNLAATSFGLYLLHYPLLNFVGAAVPGPPDSTLHRILVFSLALGAALGLACLIEPRKTSLKRHLRSTLHFLFGQAAPQPVARQRLS